MRKIWALFKARNLEFVRDKGALSWNFIFPIFIILGISLAFNGHRPMFKVGYLGDETKLKSELAEVYDLPHIKLIKVDDWEKAKIQLQQHNFHLLINLMDTPDYWVNTLSREGQFLDKLLSTDTNLERHELTNKQIGYVDWLLPGILAINMMYGALYGVGYVIVRYRKNGYLKRLQATPLRPFEFLCAQLGSRLVISQIVVTIVFIGCCLILKLNIQGNYLLLLLLSILGSFSLIGLGLMLCSRVMSEELSRGLLEMMAWPMLLLSQAFISLDQAHVSLQWISKALPLTYLIHGWREVMYYGAGFKDIMPDMIFLTCFGFVCLLVGAKLFKWHPSQ